MNTASVLGGDAHPELLAIYLGAANGRKLAWTSGDSISYVQGAATQTISIVQLVSITSEGGEPYLGHHC